MRLFIAVRLPPEFADRAAALLPAALPALKRVRPELLHLTLAFLGPTPDSRLEDVIAAARTAARAQGPFEVALAGAGRFPGGGRPRVVWLGIGAGKDELGTLAGAVAAELRSRGLMFDDRPFAAHLSVARVRPEASGPEARTVAAAVDELVVPDLRTAVDRIAVLESVLSPKGPRYSARAELPLGRR